MRHRSWFIVAALSASLMAVSTTASAMVVTRCGSSFGYAWFFEGPFVPPSEAGWGEDQISDGQITLTRDGDQWDIIYTDVTGTRSARADQGQVFYLGDGGTPGFHSVLIAYSGVGAGTVEHYLFKLNPDGRGEVAFSTMRPGGLIQKASILRAECGSPAR